MKAKKTKQYDAVTESRRWKEAVSRQTAGMTHGQVLAFFDKERVIAALRTMSRADKPACVVREEPPRL